VIDLRNDQSFCHHAFATPGSHMKATVSKTNQARFTIYPPIIRPVHGRLNTFKETGQKLART
jgi:hypothetical protein